MVESGRWGEGAPGSASYFSHSNADPYQIDMRLEREIHAERFERLIKLRELAEEAATNGPIISAMGRWLEGEPVPTFEEQLDRFGIKYANYMYAWSKGIRPNLADLDDTIAVSSERSEFIRRYGFAVPTKEALDILAAHQPLLEIGAGSGHWARLLAMRGVDIIATDAGLEQFSFGIGAYFPVQQMQGKTAVRRWPERHVFCSWPSLGGTWLRQAAKAMRPGRYLCVINESACADQRTWDYVDEAFEQHADLDLIGWHYCHDRFQEWRKRGPLQRRQQAEKAEDDD